MVIVQTIAPMAAFNRSITVNKEVLDFKFEEVQNPSGSKYFVTVYNGRRQVSCFEMRQTFASWSIVPPAPEWVTQLQEVLEKIIRNCKQN